MHSRVLRLLLLGTGGRLVSECQAWYVTAALTGMLSLDHLSMDPRETAPVPIPECFMPAYELDGDELLNELGHGDDGPWRLHPYRQCVRSYSATGHDWNELMKYFMAFLIDRDLWHAGQYYLASSSIFAFVGDDVRHTLHERSEVPENPYRAVDAESALWLAYKAAEAIVGDPSGRVKRLRKAIADAGLEDFPGVWRGEDTKDVVEHLVEFVALRDKQAAHGKHHGGRRPLTFFEVMNAQYLSRGLLLHYAESVLQKNGLPLPDAR